MLRSKMGLALGIVAPILFSVGAASSCGQSLATGTGGAGGQGGSGGGGGGGAPQPDSGMTPLPDAAPVGRCTTDKGGDPVGLCVQKQVLFAQHEAGFVRALGVAQSWSSRSFLPDPGPGGKPLHDLHDDAAYAASAANFHASAGIYGDTELTPTLDADLIALAPLLVTELHALPDEYGGELYAHLRAAAGGLRTLNKNPLAAQLDVVADAYGRAIFAHFVSLAAPDGGTPGGVLGTPAAGGEVAYAPADVASGALALFDLASRHPTDPMATAWVGAGVASLDHLWSRAREATTGLLYGALVTSADANHDALAGSPAPDDALLADVQGEVALSLLRARDLAPAGAADAGAGPLGVLGPYPLEDHATALLAAMNAPLPVPDGGQPPTLWDGVKGGYVTGYVPSTQALLAGKTTRANALLFAAIRRAVLVGTFPQKSPLFATLRAQQDALRTLFLQLQPLGSGFLSVLPGQSGYLLATTEGFTVPSAGPGDPRPTSYFSAAISVAIDGLNEQWFGLPQ